MVQNSKRLMKKLLIFHPLIAPYRIDLFNDLSQFFTTRVCLTIKNSSLNSFDDDAVKRQFQFNPTYLKPLLKLKGRMICKGYWKHLNEFNPDIVLVSEFSIDAIITTIHRKINRRNYKIVSMCDDSYNMVAENNDFSFIHKILRKIIVPQIDELILVEKKVTEWYNAHYGKGIFFPIIKNDDQARENYRKLLPLSKDTAKYYGLEKKCVFLFVGRLIKLKNVTTILKAYAKINNKDTALVIIGDGEESTSLQKEAKALGINVIFTGRLTGDKLLLWYNIANYLILSSYTEAFGAVTNEALLAGCKGIISINAGSNCLIKEGINGYIFNPSNIHELATKMVSATIEYVPPTFKELRESQMLIKYKDLRDELINRLVQL